MDVGYVIHAQCWTLRLPVHSHGKVTTAPGSHSLIAPPRYTWLVFFAVRNRIGPSRPET